MDGQQEIKDIYMNDIWGTPPLKLTFSHLKMDAWNTILSSWGKRPIFRCEVLVSGSVYESGDSNCEDLKTDSVDGFFCWTLKTKASYILEGASLCFLFVKKIQLFHMSDPKKFNNYNKTRSYEERYRFWEFAVSVYIKSEGFEWVLV